MTECMVRIDDDDGGWRETWMTGKTIHRNLAPAIMQFDKHGRLLRECWVQGGLFERPPDNSLPAVTEYDPVNGRHTRRAWFCQGVPILNAWGSQGTERQGEYSSASGYVKSALKTPPRRH